MQQLSVKILLLTGILLAHASLAEDLLAPKGDPLAQSSNTLNSGLLTGQDEFLPVAEAFKPSYTIAQGKLVLHWQIADGYYLYEERFKFRADEGISIAPAYTPGKMKYDELFERETMVHYHEVSASFDLAGIAKPFDLKLEYQGCADAGLCYPPQKLALTIDPASASVIEQEPNTQIPSTAPIPASTSTPPTSTPDSGWILQAILFALLGGVILNLMPCVFPVLSIKVMSLAAADRSRLAIHGWVYTLGIVVC
ncbi:MAG TPA: protein-disulfide reductase DsbD domain-containing protein, partial [Cellvibrio sp.]